MFGEVLAKIKLVVWMLEVMFLQGTFVGKDQFVQNSKAYFDAIFIMIAVNFVVVKIT